MVFQHNSRELDFGSLGFGENRELYFTLRNNNPVNVSLQNLEVRGLSPNTGGDVRESIQS